MHLHEKKTCSPIIFSYFNSICGWWLSKSNIDRFKIYLQKKILFPSFPWLSLSFCLSCLPWTSLWYLYSLKCFAIEYEIVQGISAGVFLSPFHSSDWRCQANSVIIIVCSIDKTRNTCAWARGEDLYADEGTLHGRQDMIPSVRTRGSIQLNSDLTQTVMKCLWLRPRIFLVIDHTHRSEMK